MNNKKFFFAIAVAFVMAGCGFFLANAQGTYTPMEPIPGTASTSQTTFPEYVAAIYRFAVWGIGIAALFMISIGGFMYLTAAGNTSKTGKAKGIIEDAIWGLVAVMVAWAVLNIINPDLVKIDLSSLSTAASTKISN